MPPTYPDQPHNAIAAAARVRWLVALLFGGVFLMGLGCTPTEPAEQKINAKSPLAFNAWQTRFASRLSPGERARFESALQEIRLRIMADREATGSDPISDALRTKIDGRPVREVLQLAVELRLARLLAEHAALNTVMRQNAMLQTRDGDKASEDYLVDFHRKQTARLEKLEAEIEASQGELEPLMKKTGRSVLPEPAEPPVILKPGKWRA